MDESVLYIYVMIEDKFYSSGSFHINQKASLNTHKWNNVSHFSSILSVWLKVLRYSYALRI